MDVQTLVLIGVMNFLIVAMFCMSGGIGLIMRPVMLFLGVPPTILIGTTRTASLPASIISISLLHKAKKVDWKLAILLGLPSILGALIAIVVIVQLSEDLLRKVIGALLLVAGTIFLVNKELGIEPKLPRLKKKIHLFISYPFMFITGAFLIIVGGAGPLSRLLYIVGYGKTYIEAAATDKLINFAQTLLTGIIFIYLQLIDWSLLIALALSSMGGQYVGTRYALHKGEHFLRILMLIVVFVSGVKLLFF